jgi:hypothetical protein
MNQQCANCHTPLKDRPREILCQPCEEKWWMKVHQIYTSKLAQLGIPMRTNNQFSSIKGI